MRNQPEEEVVAVLCSTTITYQEVADVVGCSAAYVHKVARRRLSEEVRTERRTHYATTRGELSPNFKHGLSTQGYRVIHRPSWYTGTGSGRILEHIIVACQSAGITELPAGCVVHHIDGTKLNNEPFNLIILTNKVHQNIHKQIRQAANPPHRSTKCAIRILADGTGRTESMPHGRK